MVKLGRCGVNSFKVTGIEWGSLWDSKFTPIPFEYSALQTSLGICRIGALHCSGFSQVPSVCSELVQRWMSAVLARCGPRAPGEAGKAAPEAFARLPTRAEATPHQPRASLVCLVVDGGCLPVISQEGLEGSRKWKWFYLTLRKASWEPINYLHSCFSL